MPFTASSALNIFLSYVKEDQAIAEAIAGTLRAAFPDKFDITLMSEFPDGLNWRSLIDDGIDVTDIMIAIATGQLRASHSFTGYEVGCFAGSMRYRPKMKSTELDRRMIPFAVLDKTPGALADFQGIDIPAEKLRAVRFDLSEPSKEMEDLSVDGSRGAVSKIVKLLSDLDVLLSEAEPRKPRSTLENNERFKTFSGLAVALCQLLISSISNREKVVEIPKSKLIIRVPPGTRLAKDSLSRASVQTQGPCSDSFGCEKEQVYSWSSFLACAASDDIAQSWNEAFSSLLDLSETDDFIENNTILSFDKKRIFRLFVARRITLYSSVREHHVYVIPMLKPKDYGSPKTTLLLRALQVSLSYRFMFLEENSAFSPNIVDAVRMSNLQGTALEMQNALNMLLHMAEESGLNDPAEVKSILSGANILDVYALWDREKDALYESIRALLAATITPSLRSAFIGQLRSFCDQTRELNRHYTTSVMRALTKRIQEDERASSRGSRAVRRPPSQSSRRRTLAKTGGMH